MFFLSFLSASELLPNYSDFSFQTLYRAAASQRWMDQTIKLHEAFLLASMSSIEVAFSHTILSQDLFVENHLHYSEQRQFLRAFKNKRHALLQQLLSVLRLMQFLNHEKGIVAFHGTINNIDDALQGALSDALVPLFRSDTQSVMDSLRKGIDRIDLNIWGQDAAAECALPLFGKYTLLFSTRAIWQKFLETLQPESPLSTSVIIDSMYPNFERDWAEMGDQVVEVPHVMRYYHFCTLEGDRPHTISQLYTYRSREGDKRVVKVIPRNEHGIREAMIMFTMMPCPFLAEAQRFVIDPLFIAIDMPYYPNTFANVGRGSFDLLSSWMLQLLVGLEHLAYEGIIHRDIKPDNIFYDGRGRVCLGDFGLAVPCGVKPTFPTAGSASTIAPEVMGRDLYDGRVDMFSLGATLYMLLHGQSPFSERNIITRERFRPEERYKSAEEPYAWLYNLVLDMMHGRPEERPTIEECAKRIHKHCPRAFDHVMGLCVESRYISPMLKAIQEQNQRVASISPDNGLSSGYSEGEGA